MQQMLLGHVESKTLAMSLLKAATQVMGTRLNNVIGHFQDHIKEAEQLRWKAEFKELHHNGNATRRRLAIFTAQNDAQVKRLTEKTAAANTWSEVSDFVQVVTDGRWARELRAVTHALTHTEQGFPAASNLKTDDA
jgi:hypothetical protein